MQEQEAQMNKHHMMDKLQKINSFGHSIKKSARGSKSVIAEKVQSESKSLTDMSTSILRCDQTKRARKMGLRSDESSLKKLSFAYLFFQF